MGKSLLLGSIVMLGLVGCAPRQAMTTWGFSAWYNNSGASSMGVFDERRRECLEQVGVADDPASVAPNSPQEASFIECMNGAHWCTEEYNCNKPDI